MHGYYFIYKRRLKSNSLVYYYKFYRSDGSLSFGKSTGCRTKLSAKFYCDTLLKEGKINNGSDCSFSQYATHFFDDDSIWVLDRKALGTIKHPAISELNLEKLQMTVRKHLLPYFNSKKFNLPLLHLV